MRYSNLKLAGAVAALMLATAPAAFAAGTTALTAIESTVNITFTRGSDTVEDEASITFYVDRKVDFLTQSSQAGSVPVDLGDKDSDFTEVLEFTLANTSNASIGYVLSTTGPVNQNLTSGGVTFHVLEISRNNGDNWAAADLTGEVLEADETVQLRVNATFAPDTNGEIAFKVIAAPTAAYAEETGKSILDGGADNMNTVHLFEAGDTSAQADFVITAPTLTATKTVTVINEAPAAGFDCAADAAAAGDQAALPGACIEYTITVNNTGGAAMRNLVVIDDLPVEVTYAGYITADFGVAVAGNEVMAEKTGNLGNGASAVLKIRALID